MSLSFNYRHLYYFWVVAHEGGIGRAAARLGMAVQTVSAQVHALERDLGHALLKPAGRGVALTEAGAEALKLADQIFALGETLPERVRQSTGAPVSRLVVGVSDGLAKLVVRHLMAPAMGAHASVRFHEGQFGDLLAQLALHRLDVVLADRVAPPNPNLRLYTHPLGSSPLAWYAAPPLAHRARDDFPRSLARVPVLLPSARAATRAGLDAWLERLGIRPQIAGEFDDTALMKTFGSHGAGVFPASQIVESELVAQYGVERVGDCAQVTDAWFAVGTERKVQHPLVARLMERIGQHGPPP